MSDKNGHILLLIIATIFVGAAAGTQTDDANGALRPLNNEELYAAFVGKTHTGYYRDYLNRYGSIKFFEAYDEDGFLTYKGGGVETGGIWDIEDGKICFDYDHPDFLSGCYVVTAQNGCYYSYDVTDGLPVDLSKDDWWIYSHWRVARGGTKPQCIEEETIS